MSSPPSEAILRLLAQQPWDALIAVAHQRGKYARPLTSRYLGHVQTTETYMHVPGMTRKWASDK